MPIEGNKLKFLDNVPEIVTFRFDQPKVWDDVSKQDGKPYKKYSYAVTSRGVDVYMSVYEHLNNMLQSLGGLKGREIEISHVQDPSDLKRKHWIFKEHGNVITPTLSQSMSQSTPVSNEETLNKMREWAKTINERLASMEKDIQELKNLRTLLVDMKGEPAVDLHESMTGNPGKLGEEYDNIPTI